MTIDTRIARLRSHAHAIGIAHKCILMEIDGYDVSASMSAMVKVQLSANSPLEQVAGIQIPYITNDTIYAVAMHEIGHNAHPSGAVRWDDKAGYTALQIVNLKVLEEESAWEWARRYALEWTAEMNEACRFGLSTYYEEQHRVRYATSMRYRRKTETLDDFIRKIK